MFLKSADASFAELVFLKRVSTGRINMFPFLREEFHDQQAVPNMENATTFGMMTFLYYFFHILVKEDQDTAPASSFEVSMSSLYKQNTSVLTWRKADSVLMWHEVATMFYAICMSFQRLF